MLQAARSPNSTSFLREAQDALILFQDSAIKELFTKKIKEVIAKRQDPHRIYTGAKSTRTDILSYLEKKGEVLTANVWCRNIVLSQIQDLKERLYFELQQNNVEGIVEIHLQDREINSPHIQFVGNNAEKAEHIIANIVVNMGFEYNFESAISSNAIPAYEELDDGYLSVKNLRREIERQEKRTQKYTQPEVFSVNINLDEAFEILDREQTQQRQENEQTQRLQKLLEKVEEKSKNFRTMLESFRNPSIKDSTSKTKTFYETLHKKRELKNMSNNDLETLYRTRRKR